jgi:uncharacterized protein (DUF302 family)
MSSPPTPEPHGVASATSPTSVEDTVARLTRIIADRGLTLFSVVDHSGEARKVGLDMPDTKLVIFGSPAAGTPLMQAAPLAGLDLPLKLLVWADRDGTVRVSYNTPRYLAARYGLDDELRARVEPIEAIANATVARSG